MNIKYYFFFFWYIFIIYVFCFVLVFFGLFFDGVEFFEYVVDFFEVVGVGGNGGYFVGGDVVFLEMGFFVEVVYLR